MKKNSIVLMVLALILTLIIGAGTMWLVDDYKQQKAHEEFFEVTYDVIAENDEFYILQDENDIYHFEQVEKSKMYEIGDTVTAYYVNGNLTSIWLYVDC